MNLHQLECFVSAASYHSFSLAARKLYLSQPNLSKSIEQLEKELGVILFHRTNKGVSLTIDGIDLLNQATSILNQVKSINDYYNNRKEHIFEFKISSLPIYPVIKSLCQIQNPHILTRYYEKHRSQVIQDVINNQSEIGIIMTSSIDPLRFRDIFLENHLEFHILKEAAAQVYFHKNHPLAKNKNVSQNDLQYYQQIIFNLDSYTETNLISFSKYCSVTNSIHFANELMKSSQAFIIQTPWDKELFETADIISRKLQDSEIRVQIGYCFQKNRQLSLEAHQFINTLKNNLENS